MFADPSHAWVRVKRDTLVNLGIADKISSYSYQRGEHVFLEEDCDFGRLVVALDAIGKKVELVNKHTNRTSKIRGYESYINKTVAKKSANPVEIVVI